MYQAVIGVTFMLCGFEWWWWRTCGPLPFCFCVFIFTWSLLLAIFVIKHMAVQGLTPQKKRLFKVIANPILFFFSILVIQTCLLPWISVVLRNMLFFCLQKEGIFMLHCHVNYFASECQDFEEIVNWWMLHYFLVYLNLRTTLELILSRSSC